MIGMFSLEALARLPMFGSTDIEQKIRSMELVADFLDPRVASR